MKQKKNAPGRAQQEYMAAEEKLRAGNGAVEQDSLRGEVYDWIQCVVAALVVCVLLFSFAVRLVDVVGNSMYPTLETATRSSSPTCSMSRSRGTSSSSARTSTAPSRWSSA